jgi:hypothetical protein
VDEGLFMANNGYKFVLALLAISIVLARSGDSARINNVGPDRGEGIFGHARSIVRI